MNGEKDENEKLLLGLLITTSLVGIGIGAQYKIPSAKTSIKAEAAEKGVTVYFKCESGTLIYITGIRILRI